MKISMLQSTMNILLLEDTFALNKAIKEVLELDNHHVISFTDGLDAVKNISSDIDLYLLDITVPNINGLDVLNLILEKYPKAKVILVSADIALQTLYQSYAQESIKFIKKPFMIKELQDKVSKLGNQN